MKYALKKEILALLERDPESSELDVLYQSLADMTEHAIRLQQIIDASAEDLLKDIKSMQSVDDAFSASRCFDKDWFEKAPYSQLLLETIALELYQGSIKIGLTNDFWRLIANREYNWGKSTPIRKIVQLSSLLQKNEGVSSLEESTDNQEN